MPLTPIPPRGCTGASVSRDKEEGPEVSRGRRADSAGFTLAEVLIVCVVVGLLVLVAVPSFSTIRSRGQEAVVRSDGNADDLSI